MGDVSFQRLLSNIRSNLNKPEQQRDKGTIFEDIVRIFLENDSIYKSKIEKVCIFANWAQDNGIKAQDTGVDLVAKIKDSDGFCAIQCKFYDSDKTIQKPDIQSFISELLKEHFTSGLIVDTTKGDWGKNAEDSIKDTSKEIKRIGIKDFEDSNINWSEYLNNNKITYKKKDLRDHQKDALSCVIEGLKKADRGKLIMACGTGKTFTSLKIAEHIAGSKGLILYLVPSLSLMSQTIREWHNDSGIELNSYAVCSDSSVGKKSNDDFKDLNITDLQLPATTDAKKLAQKLILQENKMSVIFSTYHSIQVISDAQNEYNLKEFDLIICDEAHRTTGVKLNNEDESNFIKVHSQEYIKGLKRLYMSATPRIYSENVKKVAKEENATLCSMDDEEQYGKTLYTMNFGDAVQKDLLTDYKVLVLAVSDEDISKDIQKLLSEDNELKLDDATKIVGCYKAILKDIIGDGEIDKTPMKKVLGFCNTIANSKLIAKFFSKVVDEYNNIQENNKAIDLKLEHIDGSFSSKIRAEKLDWLDSSSDNKCHILTNVRCLSEGVDVPSLDGIVFFHPRKSQVDIVQSVGRVMRKAEGKNLGYIILPIGIPPDQKPEDALNKNERYKVVWQVLNALRSHDERLDGDINRFALGGDSNKIEIVAISDSFKKSNKDSSIDAPNIGSGTPQNEDEEEHTKKEQSQPPLYKDDITRAIKAQIVKKCGTRDYWDEWGKDIAKIATTHITRIKTIIQKEEIRDTFNTFLRNVQNDLNPNITKDDVIEMLSQQLITKRIFDIVFKDYSFTKSNPVSIAMQDMLDTLQNHNLNKENKTLEGFYKSVENKAQGIKEPKERQEIIKKLYDSFFKGAFPKMSERLGIVYTPTKVVDFILRSVNDILKNEFNLTLGSRGVNIIDPFTGTGLFIARLISLNLITKDELKYKYKNEIHANEMVLLAYYIASINIENAYFDTTKEYEPFNGILLTDTFAMYEKYQKDALINNPLEKNTQRINRQKKLNLKVIIGNPPYSVGQKSANDNNQNIKYEKLDNAVKNSYVLHSKAQKTKTYDTYIKAIRWASDRLKNENEGIVAFVTNGSFLDSNSADGLRKCLKDEYGTIYIIDLRGNQRTKGEISKKEGGKIFGSGSRAPISINFFIKGSNPKGILYYDIGDYKSKDDKLNILDNLKSINTLLYNNELKYITPDKNNDWINQRDESFLNFIKIGDKKDKHKEVLFETYSMGILTSRDAWAFNYSKKALGENIKKMIDFYNNALIYNSLNNIDTDKTKIAWSDNLKEKFSKGIQLQFKAHDIRLCIYRPFSKQFLYYGRDLNERVSQMPSIFPNENSKNIVIITTGRGTNEFSTFISNIMVEYSVLNTGQCFPLYYYEKRDKSLLENEDNPTKKDAITDYAHNHFKEFYKANDISKEDIFYYIYALLHNKEYIQKYHNDLCKDLARIARVKRYDDFKKYCKIGRELSNIHLNYEDLAPYDKIVYNEPLLMQTLKDEDFKVGKKWEFGKKGKDKDKSTVIYNSKITIKNIPLKAYEYKINGKSALEWVMERQVVSTHKDSQITNDANHFANEHMQNPRYPIELFLKVITLSIETLKLIESLPKLDIEE